MIVSCTAVFCTIQILIFIPLIPNYNLYILDFNEWYANDSDLILIGVHQSI